LYSALKKYSRWGKITESAWAIVTSHTYVEIRNNLKQYIDSDDRLMVIKSGKSAAWTKAIASDQWLKENLIK
jgi:predicted transcriptional regulator